MPFLDACEWKQELQALPVGARDLYFTPEYHLLHQALGEGDAECFAFESGRSLLMVPGMRTPIPGTALFDLQTPNGYGGPLAVTEDDEFIEIAWNRWRDESTARGVIAGFFRLHALIRNRRWLPASARIIRDRSTVFVDLSGGLDKAWADAKWRHRNRVAAARRGGALVRWNDPQDWIEYAQLYARAMDRLGASGRFRFNDDYFQSLRAIPGTELACLRDANGLIGGHVFLFGETWGHYHLGARRDEVPPYATSFLMQAGFERAHSLGLRGVYLGGGATTADDDGVLRYKTQFGGTILDFEVALVVASPARFDELVDNWKRQHGRQPQWLLGYRQEA